MKGNEGYWGGGISIITQNFPKSPSILFPPLQSSVSSGMNGNEGYRGGGISMGNGGIKWMEED
jgi:hypothetical protein